MDMKVTLNDEECKKIVRKSLKLKDDDALCIKHWEINTGTADLIGFMGEYFKLVVTLEDKDTMKEHTKSYFIKSVPISNKFHRDECLRKGFFNKETRIYTEILPNLQKYAPTKLFAKCYYSRKDLLVLEDLSTATKNLQHLDCDTQYKKKHHHIMLGHLAKLHAASIAWEVKENMNIYEKFKDVLIELQLTMKNEWYVTGIKGIEFLADMHPKFQDPDKKMWLKQKLRSVLYNVDSICKPSKIFQNVFCHRDSWNQNIFFQIQDDGEPTECRIVDFQLSTYLPPGIDVLYFIYVTTTIEEREKVYYEYLNYYHDSLVKSLKELDLPENIITKEDFLEDCRKARLLVLIVWTICEPLMKMPKGLLNKMRSEDQEKFDHYMNTDRSEFFLNLMSIYPGYTDIIMRPIEELLNYMLTNKDLC